MHIFMHPQDSYVCDTPATIFDVAEKTAHFRRVKRSALVQYLVSECNHLRRENVALRLLYMHQFVRQL